MPININKIELSSILKNDMLLYIDSLKLIEIVSESDVEHIKSETDFILKNIAINKLAILKALHKEYNTILREVGDNKRNKFLREKNAQFSCLYKDEQKEIEQILKKTTPLAVKHFNELEQWVSRESQKTIKNELLISRVNVRLVEIVEFMKSDPVLDFV